MENKDIIPQLEEIYASAQPDIEKLTQAFDLITKTILNHSEMEIELLRAMNDKENLVKEQIKNGMIKHIRGIYHHCYRRVIGKRA